MNIQHINKTIISLSKAFSKNNLLNIEYGFKENNYFDFGRDMILGDKIILPKSSSIEDSRASFDMALSFYFLSNNDLHEYYKNSFNFNFIQSQIFDHFEKSRVVINIQNYFLGMSKNIIAKLDNDLKFNRKINDENIYSLILLSNVFNVEGLNNSFDHLLINKKILKNIKALDRYCQNQDIFALNVKKIIELIDNDKKHDSGDEDKKNNSNDYKKNEIESTNEEGYIEKKEDLKENDKSKDKDKIINNLETENKLVEDFNSENPSNAQVRQNSASEAQEHIEYKKLYKIFTNKYDEIISPLDIITKIELENLRRSLETRIEKLDVVSQRLSLALKRKLIAKKNTLQDSQNQGVIDRKKLCQIIADPTNDNIFITQKNHEYQNTIVSILLDNSGSMRGSPIIMAAMACEVISSILERFSIKTEILGFTTVDWKGGKSRKLWEKLGKKSNPGRLNDIRHIIYKSANQTFKKSKINLGLMLREGILKENIDGEAILWARSRLIQREEKRKILIIISDGTPVDDSTNSTNDQEVLCNHLNHVINVIQRDKAIELVGVGIGHDVNEFYKNSIVVKNIEDLGDVMIEKIVNLI